MLVYYPVSLSECWTNIETGLYESLRRGEKDISETSLSVYEFFLMIRVVNEVDLPQRCFKSKGTSVCMIIKLANIHAKSQYLYKGNWKEGKIGVSPEVM